MRWFFLPFIALFAVFCNVALLEKLSVLRVLGAGAVNLFAVTLFMIWWFAYFSNGSAKAKGMIVSHAMLMLSFAVGLALLGASAALTDSCENFISSSRPEGLRTQIVTYVQSLGYCRELGLVIVFIGLFVAYPSLRLFFGLFRRA